MVPRGRARPPPRVPYLILVSRSFTQGSRSHHAPQLCGVPRAAGVSTREGAWSRDQSWSQRAGRPSPGSQSERERRPVGARALERLGGVCCSCACSCECCWFRLRWQKVGSSSWRRRNRSRSITMNGPWHIDSRERVLKLGETFEKQPRCAFHTLRCE